MKYSNVPTRLAPRRHRSRVASPIHPGEFLREDFLPDYGLDASQLASRLTVPAEKIVAILAEAAPIDADLALRLGRLFGTSAQLWMNLQQWFDLEQARHHLRPQLMQVRPLSDTGWDVSQTADEEHWRDWIGRTSADDLLKTSLTSDWGVPVSELATLSGLHPERIHSLAAGDARFSSADDEALSAALGLSSGFWLRAQAASEAARGIDTSPELSASERVRDALCNIEIDEDVRVLYAVESGSRAWGFESRDSDYDVRFIYVRRPEHYVSIRKRRDVIERPLAGDLDVCGWDLPKALGLLGKSNPPLLEWLRSPTVYVESGSLAEKMRDLAARHGSRSECQFHYLHMAQGNFVEYLQGESVRVKKYFYVLRPVLACRWIESHSTLPPIEFEVLAEDNLPAHMRPVVEELLARRRAGDELASGARIPTLNQFLEAELQRLECVARSAPRALPLRCESLDALLHEILHETWAVPI